MKIAKILIFQATGINARGEGGVSADPVYFSISLSGTGPGGERKRFPLASGGG